MQSQFAPAMPRVGNIYGYSHFRVIITKEWGTDMPRVYKVLARIDCKYCERCYNTEVLMLRASDLATKVQDVVNQHNCGAGLR